MRATRAIIHTENLKYNLDIVRSLTRPDTKLCLAVKADAYGHGAVQISRAAEESGINYLAVATVTEGEELRQNGITTPIIVLSSVLPEETESLFEAHIDTVVYTREEFSRLKEASKGRFLRLHLKIDSGMGRIGCREPLALELADLISQTENFELGGICTHFPVSDSSAPSDIEYTRQQIAYFSGIVDKIRNKGINPGIVHSANSGAILNYPEAQFDMIRPGIIAYGYLPAGEEGLIRKYSGTIQPKPVMSLESRLMHIKKVPAGTYISYGRRYKTMKETWIGTVPAGYADGYSRLLSNKAKVLINGSLYPVAGTICMDQFMVDLGTECHAELYDKVILFGDENGAPTAADLADITSSISYELLCGISKRVPRVFD